MPFARSYEYTRLYSTTITEYAFRSNYCEATFRSIRPMLANLYFGLLSLLGFCRLASTPLCWVFSCLVRWEFCPKVFPQMRQANGFTLSWTLHTCFTVIPIVVIPRTKGLELLVWESGLSLQRASRQDVCMYTRIDERFSDIPGLGQTL